MPHFALALNLEIRKHPSFEQSGMCQKQAVFTPDEHIPAIAKGHVLLGARFFRLLRGRCHDELPGRTENSR